MIDARYNRIRQRRIVTMTDDERTRRSVLKRTGAVLGTSMLAAGAGQAQWGPYFRITQTQVQSASSCGTVLPVHTTVKNDSTSSDTQKVRLWGNPNGQGYEIHDYQYLQLGAGQEEEIELVSNEIWSPGDWMWYVDTADDTRYADDPVDIVRPCRNYNP